MLQLPVKVRIYVCTSPVDFRKGFDGLHGLVLESLGQDPLSGDWFVFLNRRRDRVKILAWEGDGLSLYYKKLEREDTRIFDITEFRRAAYNRRLGPAEAGRMVGILQKSGSRRIVMSGQGSPAVPPRARQARAWFDSTNFGRS